MDNMKDPLLAQFSEPPLKKRGFTEQLRLSIASEIIRLQRSERSHNKKRVWLPVWSGAALVLLAVIYYSFPAPESIQEQLDVVSLNQAAPIEQIEEPIAYTVQSGLLLGTRYETNQDPLDHTYRTLWIAPEHGSVAVKQEGEGLLVPYRLDFWKLDDLDSREGEQIVAWQLTKFMDILETEMPLAVQPDRLSERISFVGQQYVVIERTHDGETASWMTTLSAIADHAPVPVSLTEVVDDPGIPQEEIYAISIHRAKGSWSIHAETAADEKKLRLNQKAVSFDRLCADWTEIQQLESQAVDALCSPTEDWIAVIVPAAIRIYPVDNGIIPQRIHSIPLHPGERVVMAEWATGDYVEKWNDWTNRLLP